MALAVLLPVHVAAEGGHEAVVQRRVAAAEGACQQTLRRSLEDFRVWIFVFVTGFSSIQL